MKQYFISVIFIIIPYFNDLEEGNFKKIVGKGENAGCLHFLRFVKPTCVVLDKIATMSLWCMCVHACVCLSGFVETITSIFV